MNQMLKPQIYKCTYCSKEYKRKSAYKKHEILCKLLKNSTQNNINKSNEILNIPQYKDLYSVVTQLVSKINKLETEVYTLKSIITTNINTQNKLLEPNIILKEKMKPSSTYDHILSHFIVEDKYINYVYITNYSKTIIQIIYDKFLSEKCMIMLSEQTNIIYIYNNEWIKLPNTKWIELNNLIIKKIKQQFNKWSKTNKESILKKGNNFEEKVTKISKSAPKTYTNIKTLLFNTYNTSIKDL